MSARERTPWDPEMVSPRLQWIMKQRAETIRLPQLQQNPSALAMEADEPDQVAARRLIGRPGRMMTTTHKIIGGRHHTTVQILVEVGYKRNENVGSKVHSIQHDSSKYEFYFEQIVGALTGTITSPLDANHTIDISVHETAVATAAPAVWDHDGHGSLPANVPFVGGPNSNGSRLGAFEVYLCTDAPDVEIVPPCAGLHSKLRSRHWPNVKRLQKASYAVLLPIFHRWKYDEELRAAMPSVVEATEARQLVEAFMHKASPDLIQVAMDNLRTFLRADEALAMAMDGDFDAARIDPLRQALEEHRAQASPSVTAQADDKLTSWVDIREANLKLQAAPADLVELRRVIAESSQTARPEFVAIAQSRLQVLKKADTALEAAVRGAVVKVLRLAVPQHCNQASPGIASEARAKLFALEAEADSGLRAELAEATEASVVREICAKYAERATAPVLAEANEALATRQNADGPLTAAVQAAEAAMGPAFMDALQALRAALKEHGSTASTNTSSKGSSTLIRLEADVALRSAPSDQAELRRVVEANAPASEAAQEQARSRLHVLEKADTALEAAVRGAVVKVLRLAVPQHCNQASPGIASEARAKLFALEAEADSGLRAELAEATEASVVREICAKYAERATAPVLEEAADALEVLETADAALSEATEGNFSVARIAVLREALEEHRAQASPSVTAVAADKLASFVCINEANQALRSAPNSAFEIQRLVMEFSVNALPEVLEEANERLSRLAAADSALIAAMSASVAALRETLPTYRDAATPTIVEEAETKLVRLESQSDSALLAGLAQAKEQDTVRSLQEMHKDTATQPALNEVAARLNELEKADKAIHDAIYACIEKEPPEHRTHPKTLLKVIADNRVHASPSVVSSTEVAVVEKLRQLNADANRALAMANSEADELHDTIMAYEEHGSPEVIAVTVATLRVLNAVTDLQASIDVVRSTASSEGINELKRILEKMDFDVFYNVKTMGNAPRSNQERRLRRLNDANEALKNQLYELALKERANYDKRTSTGPRPQHRAAREAKLRAEHARRESEALFVEIFTPQDWSLAEMLSPRRFLRSTLQKARELSPRRHLQRVRQKRLLQSAAVAPGGEADLRMSVGSVAFGELMGGRASLIGGDEAVSTPARLIGKTIWDGWRPCKLPSGPFLRKEIVFCEWAEFVVWAKEQRELERERALQAEAEALAAVEERKEPADPNALLPGWQVHLDSTYGVKFYVHESGQTQWDPPLVNPPPMPPAPQLPEGWQQFLDPASRKPYYIETKTGRSTWIKPTKRRLWLEKNLHAWREVVKIMKAAAEESMKPLPFGWTENYDRRSQTYYYTAEDGRVVFERPKEAAVEEEKKPKRKSAAELRADAKAAKKARKDAKKKAEKEAKAKEAKEAAQKATKEAEEARAKKEADEKAQAEADAAALKAEEEAAATAEAERKAKEEAKAKAAAEKAEAEAALKRPWAYDQAKAPLDNMRHWIEFHRSGAMELFKKWDKNKNGYINKAEFTKALPEAGFHLTDEQMDMLFNQLDDDGSEEIDYKEFDKKLKGRGTVYDPNAPKTPGFEKLFKFLRVHNAKIIESFKKWDVNRNGTISKSEFRQMVPRLIDMLVRDPMAFHKGLLAKDIDAVYEHLDKDGGNNISMDELVQSLVPKSKKKSGSGPPSPDPATQAADGAGSAAASGQSSPNPSGLPSPDPSSSQTTAAAAAAPAGAPASAPAGAPSGIPASEAEEPPAASLRTSAATALAAAPAAGLEKAMAAASGED